MASCAMNKKRQKKTKSKEYEHFMDKKLLDLSIGQFFVGMTVAGNFPGN